MLEELYGRAVPLRGGGTTVADRDYIRESILYPAKQVVAGLGADHADVSRASSRRRSCCT